MLYVYCLCDRRPKALAGAAGKLSFVRAGPFFAATANVRRAPAVSPRALKAHDAMVRALWSRQVTVLPFRFGTVVENLSALREKLAPFQTELTASLHALSGR